LLELLIILIERRNRVGYLVTFNFIDEGLTQTSHTYMYNFTESASFFGKLSCDLSGLTAWGGLDLDGIPPQSILTHNRIKYKCVTKPSM